MLLQLTIDNLFYVRFKSASSKEENQLWYKKEERKTQTQWRWGYQTLKVMKTNPGSCLLSIGGEHAQWVTMLTSACGFHDNEDGDDDNDDDHADDG